MNFFWSMLKRDRYNICEYYYKLNVFYFKNTHYVQLDVQDEMSKVINNREDQVFIFFSVYVNIKVYFASISININFLIICST